MNWKEERTAAWLIAGGFAACLVMPTGMPRFDHAVLEALRLVRWYAREHVVLCLVPAFFIAGAIAVFVEQAAVIKYLGPRTHKALAYSVAAVSGTLLAVCSCTVLALFAGIRAMGAGLGPATTFLYSGPAINVLAVILTTRVLGAQLGVARAVGAVLFSVIIGLLMHLIFRRKEGPAAEGRPLPLEARAPRPLWKQALFFATMVGILIFANWARSGDIRAVYLCCPGGLTTYRVEGRILDQNAETVRLLSRDGLEHVVPRGQLAAVTAARPGAARDAVHRFRWVLVTALLCGLLLMLRAWFTGAERTAWYARSWGFAKQILPLLLLGVLGAGFLLGRPGGEGLIPSRWVEMLVGESPGLLLAAAGIDERGAWIPLVRAVWPLWTNVFAAVLGAVTYFATLTEVPILQGLLGAGMGKGPALALLLAGPSVSLPSILVISGVIGLRKTVVYVLVVIAVSTVGGLVFGNLSVTRRKEPMQPDIIVDRRCVTGEGPLWHPDEHKLYWVDIPSAKLFRYDPRSGEHETFDTGEPVGGFTLQADGALLLFMARGAVRLWRDEFIGTVIDELPEERDNRFNDVIADPEGRVFCGVMSTPDRAGRLYRLDTDGSVHVILEGTGTANGMGFTPDLRRMYFCDSRECKIYVFDYDRASGELSNRRVLLDVPADEGRPDGMTVDAEGCLWSARWDGYRLVRLTPDGRELRRIDFPVRKVSSVTFGGSDYTEVYVTTAGGDDTAANGDHAGALFRLDPGVRGVPEFRSRIAFPATGLSAGKPRVYNIEEGSTDHE